MQWRPGFDSRFTQSMEAFIMPRCLIRKMFGCHRYEKLQVGVLNCASTSLILPSHLTGPGISKYLKSVFVVICEEENSKPILKHITMVTDLSCMEKLRPGFPTDLRCKT